MAERPGPTFAPAPGRLQGHCVLMVRPDDPEPALLIKALDSRGLSARVVRDEPGVMSALAELPSGRRVLVVVEPGRWDRLAELICAVNAHHGSALCWQYAERRDGPRLTTLDQHVDGPGPKPCIDARADGLEADGPIGRIVTRRRAVDALLTRVPGRPLSTREVVTQQELTMLLGPVPGEAG